MEILQVFKQVFEFLTSFNIMGIPYIYIVLRNCADWPDYEFCERGTQMKKTLLLSVRGAVECIHCCRICSNVQRGISCICSCIRWRVV